jgi:uncharacterized protein YbcC (UPF0753/DUF2309 family)
LQRQNTFLISWAIDCVSATRIFLGQLTNGILRFERMNDPITIGVIAAAIGSYFLRPVLERWLNRDKTDSERLAALAQEDAAYRKRLAEKQERYIDVATNAAEEMVTVAKRNTDISEKQAQDLSQQRIEITQLAIANLQSHRMTHGLVDAGFAKVNEGLEVIKTALQVNPTLAHDLGREIDKIEAETANAQKKVT